MIIYNIIIDITDELVRHDSKNSQNKREK